MRIHTNTHTHTKQPRDSTNYLERKKADASSARVETRTEPSPKIAQESEEVVGRGTIAIKSRSALTPIYGSLSADTASR